jgi:hypothetical protein
MGKGSLRSAFAHPLVQHCKGRVVERDDAFAVEFTQRDFEPGAVAGQDPEAVEFEVEEFAEPEAGAAQQGDGGFCCSVLEAGDGFH